MNTNNLRITKLEPHDLDKCQNIWDINDNPKKKKEFYDGLQSGNRITFICKNENGDFLGEGSVVFKMDDEFSTIPNQRIYLSHLHVKPECRGQGIGSLICNHIFDYCRQNGYTEITLCVLLSNYHALRLYHKLNFDRIIFVKQDADGKHLGLLKKL